MRVRLTALVVLVAGLSVALAATIGVARIEESLVDDVLDDAATQSLFLDGLLFVEGSEKFSSFDDESVFFVEQLDELVIELERSNALEALLDEMGRSRTDGLPVLHSFGFVAIAGLDGAPTEVLDIDPEEFDGSLAFEFNLQDLAFAGANLDLARIFEATESGQIEDEALFDQLLDEAARSMNVAATTSELEGISLVVAADIGDVLRSADKLQDILLIVGPILIVFSALATWILTGRALAPVRRISQQVGVISGGTLHERVPVPVTGDEIQELGVTMNKMLDRLEGDDQRLRQFISDASHELRSPVAVLRSEAEVALRKPEETATAELAEGVLGESLRLERIVADLLVLARGDEARGPAHFTAIDLDDIALAEAARRRRVPVDTKHVSAGQVQGTREGCTRILVHLMDNAARHAESQVAVGVHTSDGNVTLWVDDDGPGIDVADRDRVFERFTRLEAARTRDTGGAGLGLAVVAATVHTMGGGVEVRESPLGGARFVVTWPTWHSPN